MMYTAQLEQADRDYMTTTIKAMQDELAGLLCDHTLKADKASRARSERLEKQLKSIKLSFKQFTP